MQYRSWFAGKSLWFRHHTQHCQQVEIFSSSSHQNEWELNHWLVSYKNFNFNTSVSCCQDDYCYCFRLSRRHNVEAVHWMAPEILNGNQPTVRSDVVSWLQFKLTAWHVLINQGWYAYSSHKNVVYHLECNLFLSLRQFAFGVVMYEVFSREDPINSDLHIFTSVAVLQVACNILTSVYFMPMGNADTTQL